MRKGFLFLLIVLAILFLYLPGLSKYLKLKQYDERLGHDIEELKTKINDLKKEEHLIKTDVEHLEQVMRRELGLVKPGEVVYKLKPEEEKPEESKVGETSPASEKTSPPSAVEN